MGAIATFDYGAWVARYPEFAAVTSVTAAGYFAEAGIYHDNTRCGLVCDETTQTYLMYMVTAHIAARYSQSAGSPAPGQPQNANTPVGRISSASEGSVSISTENSYPAGTAQWWQQTKYGSDYWEATKGYRTMRYVPRPSYVVNGAYMGRAGGWGGWGRW